MRFSMDSILRLENAKKQQPTVFPVSDEKQQPKKARLDCGTESRAPTPFTTESGNTEPSQGHAARVMNEVIDGCAASTSAATIATIVHSDVNAPKNLVVETSKSQRMSRKRNASSPLPLLSFNAISSLPTTSVNLSCPDTTVKSSTALDGSNTLTNFFANFLAVQTTFGSPSQPLPASSFSSLCEVNFLI